MASENTSIELHSKYHETGHHGRYEHREFFTLIVEPSGRSATVVLEHLEIDSDTMAPDGEQRETKRYRLTGEKLVSLIVSSVAPE